MAAHLKVFYCEACWELLPYISCPHDCPSDWLGNSNVDEGFCEEEGFLERFQEEYRMRIQVVEVLPNVPG